MLSFFRNFTKSRIGLVVVFAFLGLIALAFAAADITGLRSGGSSGPSAVVATVGKRKITEQELRDRINIAMDNMRRQGGNPDIAAFLAAGGLDQALQQVIDNAAVEQFAVNNHILVSDRQVDGVIASNPAFAGPDGKFSQDLFRQRLSQERISEQDLRNDIRNSLYISWMLDTTANARQVPAGVALPYASLQLERRIGTVGFVPTLRMNPGAPPTDAQLTAYYTRNRTRYTVPERRVVRYAIVNNEQLASRATPTEAELRQAYRAAGARFAAKEERTIEQVIAPDQATANRIAAAVRGGRTLAAAASPAGLEPSTFQNLERTALAQQTSEQLAQAAFSAARGAIVGPVQSPLGWHVAQVTNITTSPAKSFEQARAELATELRTTKLAELMTSLYNRIDDAIGNSATFDEIVSANHLQAQRTPAVVSNGVDPDNPASRPDQALAPILRAAFSADIGDAPQIVPLDQQSFAVVAPERAVPAAARPLASIREGVIRDYMIEKARDQARTTARQIVSRINNGTPIAQAISGAGVNGLPPTQALNMQRRELARAGQQVPPVLQMFFNMPANSARMVEAPNNGGYYIVYLGRIERSDASGQPDLLAEVRGALGSVFGQEMSQQYIRAIRNDLGVKINQEALAELRRTLATQGAGR